ncbi:MAG: hypothetical protein ACO1QB_01810 [Verrucomicrobiales bacterium]
MWARFSIIFGWSILVALAIPRPESREVLKNFARLPAPKRAPLIQYHPELGFFLSPEVSDAVEAINDQRSRLKGTAQDAEITLQMAQANRRALRRSSAIRQFRAASEQLRVRIKIEPTNPKLWLRLAAALTGLGQMEEAHHALMQAESLHATPGERVLIEGYFHQVNAWKLMEPYVQAGIDDAPQWNFTLESLPLDELEEIERSLTKGAVAFDQAVELNRSESSTWIARANFEVAKELIERSLKRMKLGHAEANHSRNILIPDKAKKDYARGFEMDQSPENMTLAFFLLGVDGDPFNSTDSAENAWGRPTDSGFAMVRTFASRLERLSEDQDPNKAALASECLGILQWHGLRDYRSSAETFKRATQLAPHRRRAWTLRAQLAEFLRDYPALVEIVEAQVENSDTFRNRLALAKAYELAGKNREAEGAVAYAYSLNNSAFHVNLAVANALLKRTDGESYLTQIEASIAQAEKAVKNQTDDDAADQLALTKGLYYGVSGARERARQTLVPLLQKKEISFQVREIITELGY